LLKKLFFIGIVCSLISGGCAVHKNLIPLGKGNMEADVSLGGPFIPLIEPKIPAPYASAGINYGISEKVNIEGNLHITSLFYKVAGLDIGAAYFPLLNDGSLPAIGIQPRLLVYSSLKSDIESRFRVYPFVSGTAAWHWGSGIIYTGFDLVAPLTKPDYNKDDVSIIVSPFAGYKWNLGADYSLFTELKWQGANVKSDLVAVEYIHINKHGALSLLFSVSRRF
jgi:hypothetical protein